MHGLSSVIPAGDEIDVRTDVGHHHETVNAKRKEIEQDQLQKAAVRLELTDRSCARGRGSVRTAAVRGGTAIGGRSAVRICASIRLRAAVRIGSAVRRRGIAGSGGSILHDRRAVRTRAAPDTHPAIWAKRGTVVDGSPAVGTVFHSHSSPVIDFGNKPGRLRRF